jgi:hypothetical protein
VDWIKLAPKRMVEQRGLINTVMIHLNLIEHHDIVLSTAHAVKS